MYYNPSRKTLLPYIKYPHKVYIYLLNSNKVANVNLFTWERRFQWRHVKRL